jgi:hypothetical protein
MKYHLCVAMGSLFAVSACTSPVEPQKAENIAVANADTDVARAAPNACADLTSSKWEATLFAFPGPGSSARLEVEGDTVAPSGGYTLSLTLGALDKSMPPIQHVNLVAVKPQAGGAVMTKAHVKGTFANAQPRYKAVVIDCDGKAVATVPVSIVSK